MSAYFRNTILLGAKASEVCEALCRWHADEGYQQETGRLLFNRSYSENERRAFVLWNDRYCVVLNSEGTEEAPRLRRALSDFPALIQLWARDGGWGYRLEERGSYVTSYCSKRGLEDANERRARTWSDFERLAAVCGIPGAVPLLRRNERGFSRFTTKRCAEFANALDISVAVLSFYDLDHANAGITEERQMLDWNCRLLAFKKKAGEPAFQIADIATAHLNDAARAELARLQPQIQRRAKWINRLLVVLAPLIWIAGLILILLVGILVSLTLIGNIRPLRRIFAGRVSLFCDEFVKQIKDAGPKRIIIEGNVVVNTRHGCSIVVEAPAKALLELLPRKGFDPDEPVFDVNFGDIVLSCVAHRPGRAPSWARGSVDILKTSLFSANGLDFQFEKHQTKFKKGNWFCHEWIANTPCAVYRFSCSSKSELSLDQMETLERIVRSFKFLEPRQ